jgi:hypothetical protein
MKVHLLSRHPFEALDLTMPQIPTAEVIELQRPRTRKVTSYAGPGHVFETSIAIMPQSSGVLIIPSVTAVGHVEPIKDQELHFDLASPPAEMKIAGISRHFEHPWWLVSDRVEIEQTWSSPPEEIRVGDVIQRTINVRVWGVTAEQLPVLEHSRTRGVKTSLAHSELRTKRSADGLIASASYTWDLVAEPQQVAFVAPFGLDYWDPLEHRPKKAGLPGLRLEPLPADSEEIALALMQEAAETRSQSNLIALILTGIISLPFLALVGAWGLTRLPTRADRSLRATLSGMPDTQRYTAIEQWLGASGFSRESFDRESPSRITLSDQLFGPGQAGGSASESLLSDALAFSRRSREKRLIDRLRNLWYG